MRKPKICPTVAKMLKMCREARSEDTVHPDRMKEEFGIDVLTLGDLDDFQLLQALFIEQNWALGQQGKEMQTLTTMAGLNRQKRRQIARR
jgi:hypothetical protein